MLKAIAAFIGFVGCSIGLAEVPDFVKVVGVNYGGTGCPGGTVSTTISPDLDSFTLVFDQFVAQMGYGVSASESRKFCQVNVALRFPQGWSYSIIDATYRGYASLDRGITGIQKSSYYFTGHPETYTFQSTFRGPFDGDYQRTDRLAASALVWSPCGEQAPLNIKAEVRMTPFRGFGPSSMMTVDSVDGKVKQIYGLQWQRCYR